MRREEASLLVLNFLRDSLGFWEAVEYLATLAVLLGAVGEYAAEFRQWPKEIEARHRFSRRSALVLICGLAVELVGLVQTSILSHREIAELNQQAQAEKTQTAEAGQRANEASLRAAAAENSTIELRRSLAAEETATAEARKEAAKAELALVKLKAPRSLSDAQQRHLVSELKPFAGSEVLVEWDFNDMEAFGIALQLRAVLYKAAWRVEDGTTRAGDQPHTPGAAGITVSQFGEVKLGSGATVQHAFAKAADALSAALQKLGLLNTGPGGIKLVSDDPKAKVIVVVGRKL